MTAAESIPRAIALAELRLRVAAADRGPGARTRLGFGIAAIDETLDGGLLGGALHEAAGEGGGHGDAAAATLFVAGVAARLGAAPVLWAGRQRDLFAPGLAQAGLHPDRVIRVAAGRDGDVLAAMEEGLRHGGLAAVVGEIVRAGLTATRRLQLAAEERGVTALLLRARRGGEDAFAEPSAAHSRWTLAALPSAGLAVPGVGRPRWRLTLARRRGGAGDNWIVEGCDETGRLALAAGTGDRADHARRAA